MKNYLLFFFFLLNFALYGQRMSYKYEYSNFGDSTEHGEFVLTFDMEAEAAIMDSEGKIFILHFKGVAQHIKTKALVVTEGLNKLVFSTDYAVLFVDGKTVRTWYNDRVPKKWTKEFN